MKCIQYKIPKIERIYSPQFPSIIQYSVNRMKRASTAKKSNTLISSQQKNKHNAALMNMFNSILLASANTVTQTYQSQFINNNYCSSSSNYGLGSSTMMMVQYNKSMYQTHITNGNYNASTISNSQSKYICNKTKSRPVTPNKVQSYIHEKRSAEQIFQVSINSDRRSLRPKTSVMSARAHRSPGQSNDKHAYQLTQKQDSQILYKNQTNRKYFSHSSNSHSHSHSQHKQKVIDYKIIQADTFMDKLQNKLPKTIQSTKPIGLIKAYGVNSYKMISSSQISQGRILIVANITKTTKLQTMTSLYSIFYSNKSVIFVEYVREHFQAEMAKKLEQSPCLPITKQVIQTCLHSIENKFCEMYKMGSKNNPSITMSITNSFGLSYAIVFVRNQQITICTKGSCDVKLSSSYGHKLQGQGNGHGLNIRVLGKEDIENIDYIALISDGIHNRSKDSVAAGNTGTGTSMGDYQNIDDRQCAGINMHGSGWLQAQLWQILLQNMKNKQETSKSQYNQNSTISIHELMGICIDTLFKILTRSVTCKNMSIVMLACRNLEEMLAEVQGEEELELPYSGGRYGGASTVMKGEIDTDTCGDANGSGNVQNVQN